jgi:hypothetical protein
MLIEQTTTYAYKLKYLENPSFDKVKNLAKKFIDELSQELVSFGNMHQAKLNIEM